MPKFFEVVVGENTKNPTTFLYESGATSVKVILGDALSISNTFRECQKKEMEEYISHYKAKNFEIVTKPSDWNLGWWDKSSGPITGFTTLDDTRMYYNAECQRLYPEQFKKEYLK